jgi:hypothetical protein
MQVGRRKPNLASAAFLGLPNLRLAYSSGYGQLCVNWVKAQIHSQGKKFSV